MAQIIWCDRDHGVEADFMVTNLTDGQTRGYCGEHFVGFMVGFLTEVAPQVLRGPEPEPKAKAPRKRAPRKAAPAVPPVSSDGFDPDRTIAEVVESEPADVPEPQVIE